MIPLTIEEDRLYREQKVYVKKNRTDNKNYYRVSTVSIIVAALENIGELFMMLAI